MSDVDKLQNAAEEVAQRREEAAQEERRRRKAELQAAPLADTAAKARRIVEATLDQVATMVNMRTGELPDVHELAVSILETGLLHPPLVRATGNGERPYELMAGRRRLAAMRLVDSVSEAPRVWRFDCVEGISKREALTMQFAENFHQAKPEPIQFARAVSAIMREEPGLTAADVSRLVGAPVAWTQRALRMLNLPPEILERVETGDLAFTTADIVRRAIDRGEVSQETATDLVEQHVAGQLSSSGLKFGVGYVPPPPPNHEQISRQLDEGRWAKQRDEKSGRPERDGDDGWGSETVTSAPSFSATGASSSRPAAAGPPGISPAQLDAYLLGRVLERLAPAPLLAEFGVDRRGVYRWARQLTDNDRQARLRQTALAMLAADSAPPVEIFGRRAA